METKFIVAFTTLNKQEDRYMYSVWGHTLAKVATQTGMVLWLNLQKRQSYLSKEKQVCCKHILCSPKPYVLSKIWPGQATIMNKKIAGSDECSPNAYCLKMQNL